MLLAEDVANVRVDQELFSGLLLDSEQPCPDGLVAPNGKADDKRFAVYRNNVVVGLTNVLVDSFPALKRLLGDANFMSLARLYVTRKPPTSPLMFEYGAGLPDFIEGFAPLAKYPYLADVARLERAWVDAFHAADVLPLEPDVLGSFAPEQLSELVFEVHPAAHLFNSPYAAISIFSTNRKDGKSVKGLDASSAEYGLITRPDMDVIVHQIPAGAFEFYCSLVAGETLGTAASHGLEADETFDISIALSTMLEAGLFCACGLGES